MPRKIRANQKVYEYFRENSEVLSGKYADYADALWKQNDIKNSYFKRLIDLYTVAAAIGIRIKRRAAEDSSSDNKRTIQMEQLMSNLSTLQPLMRIMLTVDDSRSLTLEEKLDSAFRLPETEEAYKNNMNLFNSYMRGGLEYLYENLIVRTISPEDEDYSDARITNMMALLKRDLDEGELG